MLLRLSSVRPWCRTGTQMERGISSKSWARMSSLSSALTREPEQLRQLSCHARPVPGSPLQGHSQRRDLLLCVEGLHSREERRESLVRLRGSTVTCMSELFWRDFFIRLTAQEMQKRNIDLSAVSSDSSLRSRCAQQPVEE